HAQRAGLTLEPPQQPLRQCPPWADRVDAYAVAGQLARGATREVDERGVGHAAGKKVRGWSPGRCASHEDDVSTAALAHWLTQRAHQAKATTDFGLPRFINLLISQGKKAASCIASGAVDEEVHASQAIESIIHHTLDFAKQGEIGAQTVCDVATTVSTRVALRGLQTAGVLRNQNDLRAFLAQHARDLTADTLTGAGDERRL